MNIGLFEYICFFSVKSDSSLARLCYSLICIEQFYLANDNVYVLYISCIFCLVLFLLCCNALVRLSTHFCNKELLTYLEVPGL